MVQMSTAQLLARIQALENIVNNRSPGLVAEIWGGDATTAPSWTLYGGTATTAPTTDVNAGGANTGIFPVASLEGEVL
jgi:hypothetical protein